MTCIVTTSWDDGHPLDFRVAELLNKYDLPGTFYVPLENPERPVMTRSQIKQLAEAGFEIGGHTLTHTTLTAISLTQAEQEILGCKRILQDCVGEAIQMFCYPGGHYNKILLDKVQKAGYIGARTAARFQTALPSNFYRIMTTQQAFSFPIKKNLLHLLRTCNGRALHWYILSARLECNWVELSIGLFRKALETGGVWHLWGHSWEIDSTKQWEALEEIFKAVANQRNILYLTNSQFINHVNARNSTPKSDFWSKTPD